MDDELELTDPDHPAAHEAATATARLLICIYEQRLCVPAELDSSDLVTKGDSQCQSTSNATPI
jgi:hypothetical protein